MVADDLKETSEMRHGNISSAQKVEPMCFVAKGGNKGSVVDKIRLGNDGRLPNWGRTGPSQANLFD